MTQQNRSMEVILNILGTKIEIKRIDAGSFYMHIFSFKNKKYACKAVRYSPSIRGLEWLQFNADKNIHLYTHWEFNECFFY